MAMNPPGHTVGMVPWKSVVTQGPQHLDPKTGMLGHFFLGSTLEQQPVKRSDRDCALQLDGAMAWWLQHRLCLSLSLLPSALWEPVLSVTAGIYSELTPQSS